METLPVLFWSHRIDGKYTGVVFQRPQVGTEWDLMYRLSKNRTAWYGSATLLVKVDDKGKETKLLFCPLKKKEGEAFLEKIADLLNKAE